MDGPVYLRTVRCEVPTIFGEDHKVTLGKAVTMKDGKDVTIISTGMMTAPALQAALLLEKQGISAGVLHMPTIKPIDEEAIAEAAEKTGKIVTVENHSIIGGLGSAVCEVVADKAPCCVARIGYQDIFLQCGDDNVLFHRYGMDAEGIATKAASLVQTR